MIIADACYVATARWMGVPLLTTNRRLAGATGGIEVILVETDDAKGSKG